MRSVLFLCVCAWYVAAQDMQNLPKYDSRYDYLDVDAILDSRRLVRNYVDCLINSQRCSPEGKALKRILPEALRTKCARCTERQKKTAVKVIKRLKYDFPDEWAKLSSRWDPTGDFTRYFEEVLDKNNFNTIYGSGNEIPGSSSPPQPTPPPTAPPTVSVPPPQPTQPPVEITTQGRPLILNRFGDEGELMMPSPSSVGGMTRPTMRPSMPPISMRPTMPPVTMRPSTPSTTMRIMTNRPTPISWSAAASDSMPTRFPLRPYPTASPTYTTAITIIDQISYKIMRTTELVSDILKNTVRAVVGR